MQFTFGGTANSGGGPGAAPVFNFTATGARTGTQESPEAIARREQREAELQAFAADARNSIAKCDEHALFSLVTGERAQSLTEAYDVEDGVDAAAHGRTRHTDEADEIVFKQAAAETGRLLREAGVSDIARATDFNGDTVLHYAARGGHAPVLRYVFNCNILANDDVNACKNSAGDTPLHDAVVAFRVSFVRQLLFLGADPAVKNKAGRSPQSLARKLHGAQAAEMVSVLKQGAAGFVCRR